MLAAIEPQTASAVELAKTCLWLALKIEKSLPDTIILDRNPQTVKLIRDRYNLARQRVNVEIAPADEEHFFDAILDEILGFGPIEQALKDDTVTEVMVNRLISFM